MNPAAGALMLMLTFPPAFARGQALPAPPPAEGRLARLHSLATLRVALGAGARDQVPADARTTNDVSAMFMWRISGTGGSRFGPAVRISVFPRSTAIVPPAGEPDVFGTLKIRPMLGGVTWRQPLADDVSLHLSGLGGWSVNRVDQRGELRDPRLVSPQGVAAVRNSLAAEGTARVWVEASPRIGIAMSISFVHTRPELTMHDGTVRRWTADHFRFETGVVFTVWPLK